VPALWHTALAAPVYAIGATFVLLKVMARFMRLRVEDGEEGLGLDIVSHGEEAYPAGEGAILVPV
jgi:ammonium transporter, Amt family